MSRRSLPLALALAACQQDDTFSGSFDTPGVVAVLDPAVGGPFREPVGYAADRHGGRVRVLALAHRGTYVATDPYASFFRGRPIATGRARLLGAMVAHAPDATHASVIAADLRYRALVRAPHVVGVDGVDLLTATPRVVDTTFTDADASGDDASFAWIDAKEGRAASEVWTATRQPDGTWAVTGSRSGDQPYRAWTGAPFLAEGEAIGFQITGAATPGDRLTITIDSGLTEVLLDGTPTALSLSPDQSRLAVVIASDAGARLQWFDPGTLTPGAVVPLPDGAVPDRLAWSEDGASLFVADVALAAAHEVRPGTPDEVRTHALPWPLLDVAPLATDDGDRLLYVAPASGQSVWVYDLDAGALRDLNLATPGVDGRWLQSPVRGLAAIHTPYDYPREDARGGVRRGRSVAISLHAGEVVWMEESTGCLVSDVLGPRTERLSLSSALADYEPNFRLVVGETAWLDSIEGEGRHVSVNACAGVAPAEGWTLRYDRNRQGWVASGEISGEQDTLIVEDQRWLSDAGALNLRVRAGGQPSQDGWEFAFNILDGVLRANGDNDGDAARDVTTFDHPGAPAIAWATRDGTTRPFVVLSAEAGDVVVRIDSTTAEIDAVWD